jgi:nitrite reductase (NADH) small subunit
VRLAPSSALPPGKAVRVNVEGSSIALFHTADRFFALDDICPHMAGPLSEGKVEDCTVTCPWHRWRYSLTTGERLDRLGSSTRTYPVEVRDGWIALGL